MYRSSRTADETGFQPQYLVVTPPSGKLLLEKDCPHFAVSNEHAGSFQLSTIQTDCIDWTCYGQVLNLRYRSTSSNVETTSTSLVFPGPIIKQSVQIFEVSGGAAPSITVCACTHVGSVHRIAWKHPASLRAKLMAGISQAAASDSISKSAAAAQTAASIAAGSAAASSPFSPVAPHADRIMLPSSAVLATDATSVPDCAHVPTMCASWASVDECILGTDSGRLFSLQLSQEVGVEQPPVHHEFESSSFMGSIINSFMGTASSGTDPILAISVLGSQLRHALAVHVSGAVRLWNIQSRTLARDSHLQRLVATSNIASVGWVDGQTLQHAQAWCVDVGAAGSAVLQWSTDGEVWTPPLRLAVLAGAGDGSATLNMVPLTEGSLTRGSFATLVPASASAVVAPLEQALDDSIHNGPDLASGLIGAGACDTARLLDVTLVRPAGRRQPPSFALLWKQQRGIADGAALISTSDEQPASEWIESTVDTFSGMPLAVSSYEDGVTLAHSSSMARRAAQAIAQRLTDELGGQLYAERSKEAGSMPELGSSVGAPALAKLAPTFASAAVLPPSCSTAPATYSGQGTVPAVQEVRTAAMSSHVFAGACTTVGNAAVPSLQHSPAVQVPWVVPLPRGWRADAMTKSKCQMVAAVDSVDLAMLERLRLSLPLTPGLQGVLSLLAPKPASAARFTALQMLTAAVAVADAFQLAPFVVQLEVPSSLAATAALGGSRKAVLQACQTAAESALGEAKEAIAQGRELSTDEDVQVQSVQLADLLLATDHSQSDSPGPPSMRQPCTWAPMHPLVKSMLSSICVGDIVRMLLSAVHGATALLYPQHLEALHEAIEHDMLARAASALPAARAQAWACAMQALRAAQCAHVSAWGAASHGSNVHLIAPLSTLSSAAHVAVESPSVQASLSMLHCMSPGVVSSLQAQCLVPEQLPFAISQVAARWEPHVLQAASGMPAWAPPNDGDGSADSESTCMGDAAFAVGAMLTLAACAASSGGSPHDLYLAHAAAVSRLCSEVHGEDTLSVPTAEHHPLSFAIGQPMLAVWVLFGLSPALTPCELPAEHGWTARSGPAVPPLWMATAACSGGVRLAAAHIAAYAAEALQPLLGSPDAVAVLLDEVHQAAATGLMGWATRDSSCAEVFTQHNLDDEFFAGPAPSDDADDVDLDTTQHSACSVLGLASTSVEATVGSNVAAATASAYSQWVQGELALCVDAAAEGGSLPDSMEDVAPISAEAAGSLVQALQQEAGSVIAQCLAAALAATTMVGSSWMRGAPIGRSSLSLQELLLLADDDSCAVSLQPLYAALCVDSATSQQQQAAVAEVVARHAAELCDIDAAPQQGLQLAGSIALAGAELAQGALLELYGVSDEEPPLPLQNVAGTVAPLAALLQLGLQAVAFHTPLDVAGCVQDADALVAMLGHAVAATGGAGTALLRSSSLAYATGGAAAPRSDSLRLAASSALAGSSGMAKLQAQAWSSAQPSLLCGSGGHAGSSIMDAWGVVHSRLNVARHPVGLQLLPLANGAASDVAPLASGQSIFMPVVDGQQFNADGSRLQRHVVVRADGSIAVRAADRRVSTPRSPADCLVLGDVEVLIRDEVDEAFGVGATGMSLNSTAKRERQSLWQCGSSEALAQWTTKAGEYISLDCTDGSIMLAAVRGELWGSNAASASQQLRRGDRMWLPRAAVPVASRPQAWESVARMAGNALPGTAVLTEGAAVLQAVLLSAQVGITAAAGALLLAGDADHTIARRLRERSAHGLITGEGAEVALLGSMPSVHQARAALCAQVSAPAHSQALLAAALGVLAPPLHGSSVGVVHSEPQHDLEAESAPCISLEAAPLPSAPLGAYAALTPALHFAACLRQYHAVWSIGAALAQPALEPAAAYTVGEKIGQALQAEQRRQHAFASAACSTAVLDSLASAGSHTAATALVHTFSAQLLHACLPAALSNDDAQAQVLAAQLEPEENDGVLDVLQETRGFADLQDALGCMYHPPDDLHGVPETIVALTSGAGVSEAASRHSDHSAPAALSDTEVPSTRKVLQDLQIVSQDLQQSDSPAQRQPSAGIARGGLPAMGQSSDADQRLSQLVAYGWRLRAAHLYAVSQLLQTMARPFAEMAKEESAELDDFRLYTLSASDRLQPLSAALVCMRCVCNEKAQARAKLYFLRDIDLGEAGATRPSQVFGAAAEGLELSALPSEQDDQDGDWVPPPPALDNSLSLTRSQSAAVAQAQFEESQRDKVARFTRKLAEDKGAVGRLSAGDSSNVVDDDVALLVSISSRQVDLALDACEFKLAVAAAAAQPMPDAASYTLQSLAARLLEHFRVREFVSLDAAPRIWGVVLESIAWRARTSPVPLCIGGAHFKPHESAVFGDVPSKSAVDCVPTEASCALRPGSFTQQVLAGAEQVDVNAYTVLASVASTQGRWADAAGWYYALAYRQAAAAASIVRDLHGVSDHEMQSALRLLVSKLGTDSAPLSGDRNAGEAAFAASSLSVLIALLTSRSTALDAALACLACLPAQEAFLVTVDTEDRIDWVEVANAQQQRHGSRAMQAILAEDVEVEAAFARGQVQLLQTALAAESRATFGGDDDQLHALRSSGVLSLFSEHTLRAHVHWGALGQLAEARSALVSTVCISQQLWLACATRQHAVVWSAAGDQPKSSFAHLQQGDRAGHADTLVSESFRLASAGRSCVPSQSAPDTPGVLGMPLAPVQLALCEAGAYDLAASAAALASAHRQQRPAGGLPAPLAQRAEPVYMPLAEVVRHAARRAATHADKPPQLPGMPEGVGGTGSLVQSLVLMYDGPHLKWLPTVAVIDETLLASGGALPAPQWAVDLAVWGAPQPPASFQAQLAAAADAGGVACGNPLAVLNVLWNHGQVDAAASVAAACLPSPMGANCPPVAPLQSVAAAAVASVTSPAELVTACNKHAPIPMPCGAFEAVLAAAGGSEAAARLRALLAFHNDSLLASQRSIMAAALDSAQREAEVQHTASRRSRRAGAAAQAAVQRAQQREAVRASADGQVLDLALQQRAERKQDGEQWQEMVQELHGPFAPTTDPVAAAIAAALEDDSEQAAEL